MANLTNINNKFLVQTGGNVGIGSTSPTSPLVVVGTGVGSSGTIGIQGANAHVGFKNSSGTFRSWVGHFNAAGHGSDADLNLKTGYGSVGNIRFSADGDTTAAQMFLQGSTGNVGIGTSSPDFLTHIYSSGNSVLGITAGTSAYATLQFGRTSDTTRGAIEYYTADDSLRLKTGNNAERMRIDSSGNVGINGASNFGSSNKAIQLFNGVYSGAFQIDSAGNIGLAQNAYQDGSWKYYQTNEAAILNLEDGEFKFFNAASGTANAGISFTERMRITSGGDLCVGVTTALGRIHMHNSGTSYLHISNDTTGSGAGSGTDIGVFSGQSDLQINNREAASVIISTSDTPRLTVNSSGNVGIGTTSPDGNLEVIASTTVSAASDSVNNVLIGLQAANRPTIILDTADTTYTNRAWNITNIGSAGSLFFGRNGLDVLVMKNDGNVGIGTTSPVVKLAVKSSQEQLTLSEGDLRGATFDYRSSTGNLNIATNGINARTNPQFTLDLNGNVGIGTASPNKKLTVYGGNDNGIWVDSSGSQYTSIAWGNNGSEKANIAYDNTNANFALTAYGASNTVFTNNSSERMRITSAGNVGIGTTSPTAKLEIVTAVGADAIRMNYGQSADIFLGFSSANPRILLQDNSNVITHNFVSNGDNYIVGSNVGIGTTSPSQLLHVNSSTNNPTGIGLQNSERYYSVRSNNFSLVFTDETVSTERMRINSSGNVGIGETNPASNLVVRKDTAAGRGGEISIVNYAAGGTPGIGNEAALNFGLENSTYAADAGNAQIKAISTASNNKSDMVFSTWNGSAFGERVRITSSGGVAIGATSTQAQLEVRNTADGSTTAPQFLLYGGASSYGAFHFLDSDAYHIFTNAAARDIEIICDSGGVKLGPGNTAWSSNSDENLKENIKPLNNVLDKIKDYRCVEYNFKDDENEDKKIGFIAQDWQKDFSQVVNKNKQDVLSIKYTETIPVLLKAIQELEARVKELENK
jgi:hypothetical protein